MAYAARILLKLGFGDLEVERMCAGRLVSQSVKVSVLCAVLNEDRYITAMMDSLIEQTLPDWELLVVDDGSCDRTVSIVQSYSARDDRIQLIASGEKMGKVAAYNLAFEHSSGTVIVLLAGDDILPRTSLQTRFDGVTSVKSDSVRVVASYKLQTFSADRRFDGMLLPKGRGTSLSGGVVGLNRILAESIFPIPRELPSEDTWLAEIALGLADLRVERQDVVLHYRIHEGNSNPRHLPFDEMSERTAARAEAYRAVSESGGLGLPAARMRSAAAMYRAELDRRGGRLLRILARTELPLVARLSIASKSRPWLWALRSHFYRQFSGLQGR